MPRKRVGNLQSNSHDLSFWGMNFMPPRGASRLLGHPKLNIAATSHILLPLLAGRAPSYKEALYWIQFAYTGDQTGAYVAPVFTVIVWSILAEC